MARRERLFRFRQFAVSHSASAMKVGTDGVTLGAWATVREGDTVADVGSGCGLVGLMMAQRGAGRVELLEIDPAAAGESAANAAASPWASRIGVTCGDATELLAGTFDRVVCNPPFFTSGLTAPDHARAAARHEGTLTLEALCRIAAGVLPAGGTLSLIIPCESEERARFAAALAALHAVRTDLLFTRSDAPARRVLMEFSPEASAEIRGELHVNSEYYRQLTSPFYLQ